MLELFTMRYGQHFPRMRNHLIQVFHFYLSGHFPPMLARDNRDSSSPAASATTATATALEFLCAL